MRRFAMPITILALSLPLSGFAANNLKPGLWEMTMKSDKAKQMPEMSPAQIEQMRKMGIEVPMRRGDAIVHKMCMTKEMGERDQLPLNREHSDCKVKNQNRSGTSYSADIVCEGPKTVGTGRIAGNFSSDGTSYTSTYDFKGTSHGHDANYHHEGSGKWLGADCGNVRPLGEMLNGPRPLPRNEK